jgi:hypothetical protein
MGTFDVAVLVVNTKIPLGPADIEFLRLVPCFLFVLGQPKHNQVISTISVFKIVDLTFVTMHRASKSNIFGFKLLNFVTQGANI